MRGQGLGPGASPALERGRRHQPRASNSSRPIAAVIRRPGGKNLETIEHDRRDYADGKAELDKVHGNSKIVLLDAFDRQGQRGRA